MSAQQCRICGNEEGNARVVAREMMFGLRDEFEYIHCRNCECLQIAKVPDDLSRYYPSTYYSLARKRDFRVKRLVKDLWIRQAFAGKGILGKLLRLRYGFPLSVQWARDWMRLAGVTLGDSLLDVGSGTGEYLLDLKTIGFTKITGIDPFLRNDLVVDGLRILKKELSEVQETYDFVMFHHSFEHMADPKAVLNQAWRIIAPGRCALLRIPVVPSMVWRTYGVNWVGFDAPRHIFLHSKKSITLLAEEAGFMVSHVQYDSDAMQFWGSEQYLHDIPMYSPGSYVVNPRRSRFTRKEMRRFRENALRLNELNDGDLACFYLVKH
jgi:SAM-dependent methyltransferase